MKKLFFLISFWLLFLAIFVVLSQPHFLKETKQISETFYYFSTLATFPFANPVVMRPTEAPAAVQNV